LLHESEQISILAIANEVPEVSQSVKEISDSGMIIWFAVIGG
jgi:hypothetical protein